MGDGAGMRLQLTNAQKKQRWLALGVVMVSYMLSFFQRFAPAGIAQDLASTFHTSAASLGALASTYFYVYTLTQIPTGVLVDTVGPRRILAMGGLIGGVGSLLFGFAPSFGWALVGRTLIGLGVSVTFVAMLKLIAVWFDENRFATMVGVCLLVGNLGSVLAGSPLSATAQAMGWRTVFLAVGVISIVLGALCWWVVRDSPESSDQPAPVAYAQVGAGLKSVLTNRDTLPALLINAGMSGSFFTFVGLWGAPYLMQVHGMSKAVASLHLSLWALGFAVGCFFIGNLSDRLGRRKPVMIVVSHLYALMWLVLLSCVTLPTALSYGLFVVLGVLTSGFSLTWACAKEVNPPKLSGMSTSVANMGGFLTAALMQPFVGWVMDFGWTGATLGGARAYDVRIWQYGMAVMSLMAILGAMSTWWLRETRCRNIWQGK
jgi:sugar phosphate permease